MKRILLASVLLVVFATPAQGQEVPECLGYAVNDDRATDFEDYLSGTQEHDVIALAGGNDQYFAWDGWDVICGNDGDDTVVGEFGDDILHGGIGSDLVHGKQDDDNLTGGSGTDQVFGGTGRDVVRGGADDDPDDLYDGPGSDVLFGGPEDTWFKCQDATPDDASSFFGGVLPDPSCGE